eukprot:gene528-1941_t
MDARLQPSQANASCAKEARPQPSQASGDPLSAEPSHLVSPPSRSSVVLLFAKPRHLVSSSSRAFLNLLLLLTLSSLVTSGLAEATDKTTCDTPPRFNYSEHKDAQEQCQQLNMVCIDQGEFILHDEKYLKDRYGKGLPKLKVSRGDFHRYVDTEQDPKDPVYGYHITQDETLPVRLPTTKEYAHAKGKFSRCTVPIVLFQPYLNNLGEFFCRMPSMMFRWSDKNEELVDKGLPLAMSPNLTITIGTTHNLPVQKFHYFNLQPFSILKALQGQEWDTVECATHAFGHRPKSDVAMMQDVDVFIAPHGAGLMNSLYMRQNKTVIELRPGGYNWMATIHWPAIAEWNKEGVRIFFVHLGDDDLWEPGAFEALALAYLAEKEKNPDSQELIDSSGAVAAQNEPYANGNMRSRDRNIRMKFWQLEYSIKRVLDPIYRDADSCIGSSRSISMAAIKYPEPIVLAATTKHTASIIWLHGLGDTGHGWADIGEDFQADLPHIKFIFPTAPTMPNPLNGLECLQISVTRNMGALMPAWYDIDTGDVDKRVEDEAGMMETKR